jgi:hypothetical protein
LFTLVAALEAALALDKKVVVLQRISSLIG